MVLGDSVTRAPLRRSTSGFSSARPGASAVSRWPADFSHATAPAASAADILRALVEVCAWPCDGSAAPASARAQASDSRCLRKGTERLLRSESRS